MRRPSLVVILLVCLAVIPGCAGSRNDTAGEASRLSVVVTTTQLADLTRNVAGDGVRVVGLLSPNRDPHDYEPTPSDIDDVSRASLVVANGVGLDDWIDGVVTSAGNNPRRLDASAGIRLRPGDDESPIGDPHIWFDPRNARHIVAAVRDALIELDPAGATGYRARANAYDAALADLDREVAALIDAVPPSQRTLVTNHDAFGYFTDRYGIRVVGAAIPSLSTSAEPNARDLARLASTIRAERVAVVFAEESVDAKLERALAREAGVRVGPKLYGDTLAGADDPAGTYVGMMRANAERLVAGFLAR